MAIASLLLKRGLALRIGCIFGKASRCAGAAGDQQAQEVIAVGHTFSFGNAPTISETQALESHERGVATEGDRFRDLFTHLMTELVRIRTAMTDEIVDIITNPEDRRAVLPRLAGPRI